MKRFSNIIYVSESDEPDRFALKQAVALTESNQAKLTVIGYYENLKSLSQDQPNASQLIQDMLEHKRNRLNQMMVAYATKDIEIEIKIFFGKPFIDIIQEVLKFGRDLLIKPVEASKDISHVLFGSLDSKLLRKCPCPVWLIKPTEQKGFREIVVALDYEPDNPENDALNTQLLTMAVSLAFSEFAELHVVHAWELPHEGFLRSTRMQNSKAEIDEMVNSEEIKRSQWLSEKVESCISTHDQTTRRYLNPQLHVIKGEAKYVIPKLVKDLGAELIIMGTIGRSGIPGYIIGNTAETILNSIDCSVLAVKPNCFVSPVSIERH